MTERSWIERAAAGEDVEPPVLPARGTERDLIGADGKRVTPGPLDENPIVKAARIRGKRHEQSERPEKPRP